MIWRSLDIELPIFVDLKFESTSPTNTPFDHDDYAGSVAANFQNGTHLPMQGANVDASK